MDRVLLVLPSSLAVRRLSELLAESADEEDLLLRPPEIVTVGALPEKLYQARFPFATDLFQILCWSKVLRAFPKEDLKPLLVEVPAADDLQPWLELGGILSTLHRELATDLLSFEDVANMLRGSREEPRWRVLQAVQRRYLDELSKNKFWDIQTARQIAIDKDEPSTDLDIIVIGAVDLNQAQRRFLDAVADRVTALVGAPESWRDGFDPYGALKPEFWQQIQVDAEESQLHVRGTAVEAAEEVAVQLAKLGNTRSTQEITVGVPDNTLIPLLTEQLQRAGVTPRFGPGIPLDQSGPVRLLRVVSDYLDAGDYQSLASLVRLPVISQMLERSGQLPADYLTVLDNYYSETLIRSVNMAQWPQRLGMECVQAIVSQIDAWVAPLRLPSATLAIWSEKIRDVLRRAYEGTQANLDIAAEESVWDALCKVGLAAEALADIPQSFQIEATFTEAIVWILRQLTQLRTPPPPNPNAIEMLGWLDLALDDTPILILTGLHDGVVPESVNADAFLPNDLRTKLGLVDNARRYARDCYAFQTLIHSREQLEIVFHQLGVAGDPVTPSRLMLAVPAEQLGKRVLSMISPVTHHSIGRIAIQWHPRQGQTEIPIPLPEPVDPPTALSVTDFRKYIECPYRFYLNRIKRLEAIDDLADELGANVFGSVMHACLSGLKGSPVEQSEDSEAIAKWLCEELDRLALEQFGSSMIPAVQIQMAQARLRLAAFAEKQAEHIRSGWRIWKTEINISNYGVAEFDVDGVPMRLRGQIDRIDHHLMRGEWAIWDYKTSDTGKKPVSVHVSKGKWKDLQLPLYRHLIRVIEEIDGTVKLGYINLPKSAAETAFVWADFKDEELAQADEKAREIIRSIRNNVYWPPNYQNIPEWDPYGSICQTNLARRWDPSLAQAPRPVEQEQPGEIPEAAGDKVPVQTNSDSPVPNETQPTDDSLQEAFQLRQVAANVSGPPMHLHYRTPTVNGTPPAEWFNPLVIRASAGTGKTYQLALRMIRLLFTNQPLDHVLATTFTRKAAGEILKRVLGDLAQSLMDDKKFAQLRDSLSPLAITVEDCQQQLARLCSNLHRYRVSTLDAFYSQLARNFSLELNLPPGWTMADPFQEKQIRDLAISKMFDAQDHQHLRNLLSMLFKGEAGRGIQSQIRDVVESGYELFRVTKPEAWQVFPVPTSPTTEEVEAALDLASNFTFNHKNIVSSVTGVAEKIKKEDWTGALNSTVLKNCFDHPFELYKKQMSAELTRAAQVLRKFAVHQEFNIRRIQTQATFELLTSYHHQLEEVKRRRRTLTFDDISHRLSDWIGRLEEETARANAQAVDGQVDAAEIARIDWRMDARIDHLLLDEFQDTAPNQWKIIQPFAEAIARENLRRDRSFFCVGDMKQAIYGWRGGVAEIFGEVSSRLRGIIQEQLTKSWRSSPEIINFVNRVFQNLHLHENYGDGQAAIDIWKERFVAHETAKSFSGFVKLSTGYKPVGKNSDESDDEPGLMELCADEIKELVSKNNHVSIGVLVRRNVEVAEVIHLLREHRIDASQEGGNPLTDSAAVEFMMSLLRLGDHPGDRVSAFHVESSGLLDKLHNENGEGCHRIAELSREVRLRVDQIGVGPSLAYYAEAIAPLCNLRDQQRLEQLIQQGYQYDTGRPSRIRDFVMFIEQQKIATPRPAQVRVMTIHQSKGLEFDAVFLPTIPSQNTLRTPTLLARIPNQTERPDGVIRYLPKELLPYVDDEWRAVHLDFAIKDLTENLCLFYVALTRARRALYLYSEPHENPSRSWSSVLCSILDTTGELRNTENCIVYQSGDAAWYEGVVGDGAEQTNFSDDAPHAVDGPLEVQDASEETLRVQLVPGELGRLQRMRPALRPSSAGEARLVALDKALDTSQSMGQIVGTLVHRWFEEVIWLDDFQFDRGHLRSLAIAALTPELLQLVNIEEWLDQFQTWLSAQCIHGSIGRSRYEPWRASGVTRLEVTNERNLLEILDGGLVRGSIDRLVLGYKGERIAFAEILDYKTDTYNSDTPLAVWTEERAAHHAPQLQMYRRVLEKQFGLPENRVGMTLIMLSGDAMVPIATSSSPHSIAHHDPDFVTVQRNATATDSEQAPELKQANAVSDDEDRQLLLF